MEPEHLSQKSLFRIPQSRRYRRCHPVKLISASLKGGEGVGAIIIFHWGDSPSPFEFWLQRVGGKWEKGLEFRYEPDRRPSEKFVKVVKFLIKI